MYYIYLDFEYSKSSETAMDVVCCAILVRKDGVTILEEVRWLQGNYDEKIALFRMLEELMEKGAVILSYNVIAEASAIMSLCSEEKRLKVTDWKFVDLLTETKQVRNGNYKRLYGKYVDSKGNKKTSYPPIVDDRGKTLHLEKTDPRKRNNAKTNIDLSSTLWAFLGIEPDLQHKNHMRDIILRGNYSQMEKEEIIKYAASDVVHLPDLFRILQKEIRALTGQPFQTYLNDALVRGEWSARLALIERTGMPVNTARLRRIADSRKAILDEWITMLCDTLFPFYLKNKKGEWVYSDAKKEEFVKAKGLDKEWPKSAKTGKFSFAKDVLKEYEELYPEVKELTRIRNFDSQTKSYTSKTGFEEVIIGEEDGEDMVSTEGKESIFQRIGSDSRLRVYWNPYGTQTGRNAPPARSFLLAQAKWIRSCLKPPPGWCYTAVDYSSEEFIIAACESQDENMVAAYDTSTAGGKPDVYVNFGVLSGVLPNTATKKSHPSERTQLKGTLLGMQYGLGKAKLHRKLVADTGDRTITEERALELFQHHKDTFSVFWEWSKDQLEDYDAGKPLKTRDGFWLFTDNPNQMSVANFPIQGAGGAILRRAVRYAQRAGIHVVAPLHDALYVIHREDKPEQIKVLKECMNRAFKDFYGRDIRMEAKTWNSREEYVEEGGERIHAMLAKYFMTPEEFNDWPLATGLE